jgi:hypothetical protein
LNPGRFNTKATHHATVRNETAEVQAAIALGSRLECLFNNLVLLELSLLDSLVNPHDVLPNNSTSTNVEMADFGVAHQALGQTDGDGRGIELGETGLTLGELVHDRRLGRGNGVAILGAFFRGDTPTVNDDCIARNIALANRTRDEETCNHLRLSTAMPLHF